MKTGPLNHQTLQAELEQLTDPETSAHLQRFFKTGPGDYGEGDRFLGIRVPVLRKLARGYYQALSLEEILPLIHSPWHEIRMTALIILTLKFKSAGTANKKKIYQLYMRNTSFINNWDLVDVTSPHIVGEYLLDQDRTPLYTFARSRDLWKKRIAIVSTYTFIRNNQYDDTLAISEILLRDRHDLIHKAVGWMLRETGNRDRKIEESFLRQHYQSMPRTMLRYAIEKFPEKLRKQYLHGKIN